jgi:hypothetical protein
VSSPLHPIVQRLQARAVHLGVDQVAAEGIGAGAARQLRVQALAHRQQRRS